jgi:hypothetical protein
VLAKKRQAEATKDEGLHRLKALFPTAADAVVVAVVDE